ncbi:MAG: hypothetical protein JWP97_4351 [Labilithrix sp.]|nr:hypothetical protein [Labilithrix sp.]
MPGSGSRAGRVQEHAWGVGASATVNAPFAEAGLNLLFQVAPQFGVSFEGYSIRALGTRVDRDFEGAGIGLALVFGPRR